MLLFPSPLGALSSSSGSLSKTGLVRKTSPQRPQRNLPEHRKEWQRMQNVWALFLSRSSSKVESAVLLLLTERNKSRYMLNAKTTSGSEHGSCLLWLCPSCLDFLYPVSERQHNSARACVCSHAMHLLMCVSEHVSLGTPIDTQSILHEQSGHCHYSQLSVSS